MKREFSAGGIVFNNKGQVLLIHNAALRDPNKSYWGFPKGHIDQGESSKDAATREIKEETGIEAEIVQKIDDNKYIFSSNNEKIFKVVILYLMRYISGKIRYQKEELLDAGWFNFEEALAKLSFSNDKKLLQKAIEMQRD
ncbi:NUDIX hydrolase [Candidatus Daviesbacteria bacterium]|nr:NUDIX hydrolase [Candidatus Daviesbacteria bacterium]